MGQRLTKVARVMRPTGSSEDTTRAWPTVCVMAASGLSWWTNLTAEKVANTCGGEISHERVGEYVAASLQFARALPQVDASRLYVVGWSHGGAGVLAWLQALAERIPPVVAGAVAVYPQCATRGANDVALYDGLRQQCCPRTDVD